MWCYIIILQRWLVLVGGPTKAKLWLILQTTWNPQSLATGLHLENKLLTLTLPKHITYVVSSYWLPNFWLIIDTILKSLPTRQSQQNGKQQEPRVFNHQRIEQFIDLHGESASWKHCHVSRPLHTHTKNHYHVHCEGTGGPLHCQVEHQVR